MDRNRDGSLRRNSSAMWRNTDSIFSRMSTRGEEDEEEALRWAALEKLPTYSRLRKGILRGAEGEQRSEVDIEALGNEEVTTLLERLVRNPQEDHEQFLIKLKNRIDRVGLDLPTIEVRFEHLTVGGETHVGNRGVPTILNYVVNALETVGNTLRILPNRKKPISILHDLSGIVKPRRMTLLLGPPGSGKTTLLLALAGKLGSDVKVSGRVTYNGHGLEEFVGERTAAYISQHDLHIGEMTVRETLTFSARCQGVGTRYDMLAELSRREKAANIIPDPDIDVFMKASAVEGQQASVVTNYVMKILGLDVCADTMVGDDMLRGISGGQRKRVTTGEMLVGPARALFMDEISTGLDSSTTFQIVKALRESAHILGGSTLISLLQPTPETYELFDDILLLSDGQFVYQGPREHVLEFFELMGFKCPPRKGIADFLQEVTSRTNQGQYWARHGEPYRFVPMNEFTEAFWDFRIGRELREELATPFDKTKSHPTALNISKYGVSTKELLKACIERELLLMKRNSFVYIFRAFQLMFLNFIGMMVFLRTKMPRDSIEDAIVFMGSIFFFTIILFLTGFVEVAMTVAKLPVFYKQKDLMFYPAWVYAVPSWILKIPINFVEVAAAVFMNYYVIGYDPNVGRFFKQYMLFVLTGVMANALFRVMAVLGKNMVVANILVAFILIVYSTSGGFLLRREDVKKWMKWLYWSSPMMYVMNAISVNEFLGNSWNKILPGLTQPLGVLALESYGIFAEAKWYWIGVGALLGYTMLFNGISTVALTYHNPYGSGQVVVSEETSKKKYANLTREFVEVSSTGRHDNGHATAGDAEHSRRDIVCSDQKKRAMALPFVALSLTFQNIRYSVDMPVEMAAQGVQGDKLLLLKGVSGSFRPGVLTALMGASGAGKTTLMDVLSGRKTGGYIEGSITISGYPKKHQTFARVSGYCEQNDIHSPHATVYESLLYSAWLRLPAEVDAKTKKVFVEEVMELVELTPLRVALIGFPGVNGLSTEQRKRLTIAVELVANPSIIFMDEPTSGLDARAAAIVMRTVRNAVDTGRTVVCTIHQPSIDIFEAFDELLLLKRGGEEIYVGPLGRHCCHLINYFESIRGVNKIKDGYNPATWMLDVTTLVQEHSLGISFSDLYKDSELYRRNITLIEELSTPQPGSKNLYFPTQYSQSFTTQCTTCLWKQNLSYWRNPGYTAVRMFSTILIALTLGTTFWDLGSRRERMGDLLNAMGAIHTVVFFTGIQNSQAVQPVVAIERTVFYRERAARMYSTFPYAFAQVAIELPYVLVQSVVCCLIVYSMIGFQWMAAKFFWYLFFIYFTFLYFTFFGMMTTALTPNQNVSSIVAVVFYSIWTLSSGFLVPRPRIPVWWRWYYWACPVSYTLYGLLVSQYGDIRETIGGYPVEDFLRDYFGYRHDYLGLVSGVIMGFTVLFASIFALSMKMLNFQKR